MGSELATTAANGTMALALSVEDKELVRRTVFPNSSDDNLALFLHDCRRQNVHPLDRLIHPTTRRAKDGSQRYTPITSIDFMRSRAEATGEYAGNDDPTFTGTPKQDDFAATVTVWKIVGGVRCPFTATARWTEYRPDEAFMWNKMPHTMLGKCAEALALRKAFPRNLAGLYAKEEMDQADNAPASPSRKIAPSRAPIAERIRKPAVVDAPPAEDWPPDDQGASEPPQDEPATPPAFNRAACLHDLMEESVRGVVGKAAKALGLKLAVSADLKAMPDADLVRLHDAAFNNPLI